MTRILLVNYDQAPEGSKPVLDQIRSNFGGSIANIFGVLANSPAGLNGYIHFNQALEKGLLGAQLREQIALAVAGVNQCNYCASAHATLGKMAGLNEEQVTQALSAKAIDIKTAATLSFVQKLTKQNGIVDDADIALLKSEGFCDGAIVEMVANVALNIFTNYLNHVALTEIDFPIVSTDNI